MLSPAAVAKGYKLPEAEGVEDDGFSTPEGAGWSWRADATDGEGKMSSGERCGEAVCCCCCCWVFRKLDGLETCLARLGGMAWNASKGDEVVCECL